MYKEILASPYKELGYFADKLVLAKSDYDFFKIVALYIVPLIKKSRKFERYLFSFIQDKNSYLQNKKKLELQAIKELRETVKSLKNVLKSESNKDFINDLKVIEDLFTKRDLLFSFGIDEIYHQIQQLLTRCFDLELINPIKNYVCYVYRPFNGIGKLYIDKFTFAPSVIELQQLNIIWQNVELGWVAWEYLDLVEWCWITTQKFFDDKAEGFNTSLKDEASRNLYMLREHWLLMQKVKNKDESNDSGLFVKTDFVSYIDTLVHSIILQQAIEDTAIVDDIIIYKVTMKFDDIQLLLDVQWFEDGNIDTYKVTSFQDNSGPYNFFKTLFDASIGTKIEMGKVPGISSGATVAKFFDNAKINKTIFEKLFFDKRKTESVTIRAKEVYGSDLSKYELQELFSFINSLNKLKPSYFKLSST